MYAQVTFLQVPMNQMPRLRDMLETRYLPIVRQRPGFKAGYLLEQVDDVDCAQLVLFWENHAAVESFNRTGSLQASLEGLVVEMPEMQVRRQGYVVQVSARALPSEAAVR